MAATIQVRLVRTLCGRRVCAYDPSPPSLPSFLSFRACFARLDFDQPSQFVGLCCCVCVPNTFRVSFYLVCVPNIFACRFILCAPNSCSVSCCFVCVTPMFALCSEFANLSNFFDFRSVLVWLDVLNILLPSTLNHFCVVRGIVCCQVFFAFSIDYCVVL